MVAALENCDFVFNVFKVLSYSDPRVMGNQGQPRSTSHLEHGQQKGAEVRTCSVCVRAMTCSLKQLSTTGQTRPGVAVRVTGVERGGHNDCVDLAAVRMH